MVRDKMAGCAFGKVSREKIDNLAKGFEKVEKKIDGLEDRMVELFNHNSKKLHPITVLIITILTSLCVGLLVAAVKG